MALELCLNHFHLTINYKTASFELQMMTTKLLFSKMVQKTLIIISLHFQNGFKLASKMATILEKRNE